MFLVMGITGKVGAAAAKHLLALGKEVRALVRKRDWNHRRRVTFVLRPCKSYRL